MKINKGCPNHKSKHIYNLKIFYWAPWIKNLETTSRKKNVVVDHQLPKETGRIPKKTAVYHKKKSYTPEA